MNIRNQKGIYSFIEESDSTMAASSNFAMFMSYEKEKRLQAERLMKDNTAYYTVDKTIQKTKWLSLPAEKVSLKGGVKNESITAVITTAIDLPIGSVFASLNNLSGTPLEFTTDERGWLIRLTAINLKSEKLSDTLFHMDAKRKVMGIDEMIQELSDFKN